MIISSSHHFPHSYPTQYHGYRIYDKEKELRLFTFAFKTRKRTRYIVEIEEFETKIFILKFYPKCLKQCENRFKILTNENDALRILSTCLNVLIYIKTNIEDSASFGFIGALKLHKEENHINTQRFRIYKQKSETYFNPDNYLHVANTTKSTYLILDKKIYSEEDVEGLNKMFMEYFIGLD